MTDGWLDEMKDLKLSYRGTHRMLQRYLKKCEKERIDESGEYMEHADVKIVKEAISDINFAIEWMHTGRRPGNKRGIERRAAYQREKLMDPIRMQAFTQQHTAGSPANLTEWQRFQIEDALSNLSPLERDCFEMAYGKCIPQSEIATMLSLTKGNVSTILKRAQKKIQNNKLNSLFLNE